MGLMHIQSVEAAGHICSSQEFVGNSWNFLFGYDAHSGYGSRSRLGVVHVLGLG